MNNINKPIELKESLIVIGLFLIVLVFFSGCSSDYKCVDGKLYEKDNGVYVLKKYDNCLSESNDYRK